MAIISDKDREAIRRHFDANLTGDVEIVFFTERPTLIVIPGRQQCETCEDTEKLLSEVASLSDKIALKVHEISNSAAEAAEYDIDRVPAFVLKGANKGRVRFFGIPSGHEFSAFIADIVGVSSGVSGLTAATIEYLSTLSEDVNLKVFTTPT